MSGRRVVAVFRHERTVGGQIAFRYYDNGKYELKSAAQLWTCSIMWALTLERSALHRAVLEFQAAPPCEICNL